MSEPIPISLSTIETKQALTEAKELSAQQIATQDNFEEQMEDAFNPAAASRAQSRLNRFRPIEARGTKTSESKERKIQEVAKKAEEDLSDHYNKRNPELPADKLKSLRSSLKERSSPEEILRQAEKVFKDPTLVDEALEYLSQSTKGVLRESVLRARMILNEQKAREIIAGRNIDPAAKLFHSKGIGSSPTELRDLYRDITGNPRDHNMLFAELSDRYPFDDLKMVIAFLLKGMGFDLKSKGPSIQQAELMRLMTEVRNLQSILWVYLFFKGKLKFMKKQFSNLGLIYAKTLSFEMLAREFIKIVEEKFPTAAKIIKEAEKMGLKETEAQIIVIAQFRDATRQLSMRLYRTPKQRQDLLLVCLEALEELEDRIEEMEERSEEE